MGESLILPTGEAGCLQGQRAPRVLRVRNTMEWALVGLQSFATKGVCPASCHVAHHCLVRLRDVSAPSACPCVAHAQQKDTGRMKHCTEQPRSAGLLQTVATCCCSCYRVAYLCAIGFASPPNQLLLLCPPRACGTAR